MSPNGRQTPRYRLTAALTALMLDDQGNMARVEFVDVSRTGARVRLAPGQDPSTSGGPAPSAFTGQVHLLLEGGRLDGLEIPFAVANQPGDGQLGLRLLGHADLPADAAADLAGCVAKGERLLCLLEEAARQRGMPEAPEFGEEEDPEEPKSLGEQLKELFRPEIFLENLVSLVLESLLTALPPAQLNALGEESVDEARAQLADHYRPRQAELFRRLSLEMVRRAKQAPERTGIQVFRDAVSAALGQTGFIDDQGRAAVMAALKANLGRAREQPDAGPAHRDPEFGKWFGYHLENGAGAYTIGLGYSAAEFFIEAYQDRTQYADEIAYLTESKTRRRQQFCREVGLLFAGREPGLERAGAIFREEAWRMFQAAHAQVKPVQEMLSFYPREDLREVVLSPRELALKEIKFRFLNRLCDLIGPYAQEYVAARKSAADTAASAEAAQQALRSQVEEADPDQFLAEHLPHLFAAAVAVGQEHHQAARAFALAHPNLPLVTVAGEPVLALAGPGLKELEKLVARNWGHKHPLTELASLVNLRKAAADPIVREALNPIVTGRLIRLAGDRTRYLEMLYLVRQTPEEATRAFEVSGRNAATLLDHIIAAALDLTPRPKPRRSRAGQAGGDQPA